MVSTKAINSTDYGGTGRTLRNLVDPVEKNEGEPSIKALGERSAQCEAAASLHALIQISA
jgi:hypothetical protein